MNDKLIKQDINFIEYPLWFQDVKMAENKVDQVCIWKDMDGYVYRSSYKPPTKTDYIFLLYLLLQCQEQKWKLNIEITKYNLLKGCGISPGKIWYDRVSDSLNRWGHVTIKFNGIFYDGKEYNDGLFHILKWKPNPDTKKLEIKFDDEWILKIKESNFCKSVNFNHLKKLKSPLNIRLYEILSKTFYKRSEWAIDAHKLAQKIPMNEKHLSHIVLKIKPALNRINKETDLKISLKVQKQSRGKALLVFTKKASKSNSQLVDGTVILYKDTKHTIKASRIVTGNGTIPIGDLKKLYKAGKIKIVD